MITVVGSYKGGTGKSTVSFNLAVWLTHQGFNVEIVDLDPQATLTDVCEVRAEEGIKPVISVSNQFSDRTGTDDVHTIIDVGTADMDSLRKALRMADLVAIPVPPSQADVWSTQRFVKMVQEENKDSAVPRMLAFINRADTNPGIRETVEAQEALKMLDGLKLILAKLGQRTTFRRAFSEGMAVFEYEPRGKAATEFNALATVMFSTLFIAG